MQHKMIPLFSVPLFKTNIGPLDSIERTWIDSLEYPDKAVARDNSDDHMEPVNRGMHILNSGQLKNTKTKIQNALNYFTKTIMGVEQDFRLTTSWINKIPETEWIQQHSHANSVISGVYYIQTTPQCSPIVFNKPFLYTNFVHQTVQITFDENVSNQYNTEHIGVQPETGDLLLFPSWLEHTVRPQQPNVDRIGLAFNCFPTGKFGKGTYQLTL